MSHRAPQLTLHRREGEAWNEIQASSGQTIELAALALRLAVDEVYADGLEDAGG